MKVSIVSVLVFGAAALATPTLGKEKGDWAGGQYQYGNGNKPGSRAFPGHGTAKSEDCSTSTIPVVTATTKPVTTAPPEPPVTLPAPGITSPPAPPGPPVTYSSPGTPSPLPLPVPDCNVKPGAPVPVGCPAPDCSNLKPGAVVPAYCLPTSSVPPVAEASIVAVPSATPVVENKPTLAQNGTIHKPTTPPVLAGASSIARGLGVGMAVAVLLGFAFGL
ncbi:hypothetical protein MAPG_04917 [Magnaporthiopsis poae ATCC 64411]|uniref:Uncharacterized protein n=1 Tax=Magnaporthiopsis poae (strain ATCC 64411 / 73-15) TaxID=644358 RepID=A0A0C4DY07_MAGP6|nr:hypothetical protein MAPG_04917 [Magnaporthiopsis poae ATCC 64411]